MEKQKQRLVSLVLALVMCVGMVYGTTGSVTAGGEIYTLSELLEESYSGTCGDNLTWTFADGVLTISGTGDMDDYYYGNLSVWGSDDEIYAINYISAPWFYHIYYDNIKSVVVEDGVTSIGEYAFYGCTSLESITIPDSVTSAGNYAFYGTT